jgi:hypothetical protein
MVTSTVSRRRSTMMFRHFLSAHCISLFFASFFVVISLNAKGYENAQIVNNQAPSGESIDLDYTFTDGNDHGFFALFHDLPAEPFNEYQRRKSLGLPLGPRAPLDKGVSEIPEDNTHWLLNSGVYPLPDGLPGKGFLVQGTNHSDDLDYGLGKKLDGLIPNTKYEAIVTVDTAANGGMGGIGVGGGMTITLSATITTVDPNQHATENAGDVPYIRWRHEICWVNAPAVTSNIVCDKSGFMPNTKRCPSGSQRIPFEIVKGKPSNPIRFETGPDAQAWFVMNGHSGFETFASFYFTRVHIQLKALGPSTQQHRHAPLACPKLNSLNSPTSSPQAHGGEEDNSSSLSQGQR